MTLLIIFSCCCHCFILLSHNAYFGTVAVLNTWLNTAKASKHDQIPCAVNVLLISKSKKPLTGFTKATVNTSLSMSVTHKTTLFSSRTVVFNTAVTDVTSRFFQARDPPVYSPLLQVGLVVSVLAVFPDQLVGVGLVRCVLCHQRDADTQGAAVVVHLRKEAPFFRGEQCPNGLMLCTFVCCQWLKMRLRAALFTSH